MTLIDIFPTLPDYYLHPCTLALPPANHSDLSIDPSHAQRLSSTTGNGGSSPTDLARRVKNLFTSSSPLNKKRSMSLDELDSKPGETMFMGKLCSHGPYKSIFY